MSHLLVTRRFGLLPGTHNGHSPPRPAFKSYQLRIQSRPSFKRGARAQKTPAMPLLPRRKVRIGVICSTDGAIGIPRSVRLPTAERERQQGAPSHIGCCRCAHHTLPISGKPEIGCGAPWIDAATVQSIFHAEKMTLGTAGSPAGFL